MRKLLTIIILLQSFSSLGQKWKSAHNFGGIGFSQGVSIKIDELDNKYVAGHYQVGEAGEGEIEILCDKVKSVDGSFFGINSFILKYNDRNEMVWKRPVPGRIQDLWVENSEAYYAVGYFEAMAIFGDHTYYSNGGDEGYVAKYSQDGTLLWVRIVSGGQFNTVNSIALNRDGDVFISGINNDPSYFLPNTYLPVGSFLCRLDSSTGELLDYKIFSSENIWVATIAVDNVDNILVGGSYQGQVLFHDSTYTPSNEWNVNGFMAKLDKTFTEVWFKSFGSDRFGYIQEVRCIRSDESGYFLSGVFQKELKVDFIQCYSKGETDNYISKIDFDGNVIWLEPLGGEDGEAMLDFSLRNSSIYVTGGFVSSLVFPLQTISSLGYSDLFVAKYSDDGHFEFALSAGTRSNLEPYSLYGEVGNAISVDSHGDIYVAGRISGDGNFGDLRYKPRGLTDYFLAIISDDSFSNRLSQDCQKNVKLKVYPNPTTQQLTLESPETIDEVTVFDSLGKEVSLVLLSKDLTLFDVSGLSDGIYLLIVKSGLTVDSIKFLKK